MIKNTATNTTAINNLSIENLVTRSKFFNPSSRFPTIYDDIIDCDTMDVTITISSTVTSKTFSVGVDGKVNRQ